MVIDYVISEDDISFYKLKFLIINYFKSLRIFYILRISKLRKNEIR